MVSATTYTLVGVVNKFITVLLNVLIWDKHSTPLGLVSVCLCLAAGSFYQQAPKKDELRRIMENKSDAENTGLLKKDLA
jgi:GDP-mannose transporter